MSRKLKQFSLNRAASKKAVLYQLVLAVLAFGTSCATADTLFVGDSEGAAVYKFDTVIGGSSKTTFTSDAGYPYGLAFDTSSNLFVADQASEAIYKVTPAGNVITFNDGTQTGLAAFALAFDSSGNLFETDEGGSGAVYKFAKTGGILSSNATLFASTGETANALAFDSNSNLFVTVGTMQSVGKILKFAYSGGTLSSTPTTFATGFIEPYGLVFDSSGNLYVADFGDSTVMVSGSIKKFTKTGGVLSSTPTTFSSSVNHPFGVAFDSSGNLFETDTFTGMIQEFVNTSGTLSSTPITFATDSFPTLMAFLPMPSVTQPASPLLTIKLSGTNVIVSWPSPSTGFLFQTNGNLATTNWGNYGGTITVNNSMNNVAITPPTGKLFFRLKQ
jgi:sugar lactone lactonase YvrE